MRPIDVARAAGVSTQLVRNLLAEGVLPPAEHTPGGHRVLDERHRDALLAHRALVAGFGHDTAREVLLAVHADELPAALALLDAGHAELHGQRLALAETAEAVAALTAAEDRATDRGAVPAAGLLVGELAHRLGVRTSALRVWEAAGLITPTRDRDGYRRYTAADVRDARLIVLLRQSHHPIPQIGAVLDGVRSTGDTAVLRIVLEQRRALHTARSAAMLAAAAALRAYLDATVAG